MNEYQRELQSLKTWDEIQSYRMPEWGKGYGFITTAGHGYLVVKKDDTNAMKAKSLYSFEGKLAYYLEEDCDAGTFLKSI